MLIIDKPAGWTSFDVVGFVRRQSGVRRVGHAGTLDPAATGVLPLCLGQATRLIEYLVDTTKTYVAEVTLGIVTDSYDADGEVLSRSDASYITRSAIEEAVASFRGEFEQTPPSFSAIKRAGVPLYKLARRGEAIRAPPRRVRVDRLDIMSFEPPLLRLEVECSKGFYVRSLAHDLGASLGVGGMLSSLVRTRVGAFHIEAAVGIGCLTSEFEGGVWQERLYAPDEVLLDWQAAIVSDMNAKRLRNGLPVDVTSGGGGAPADRCRAYTGDGSFLAVLRRVDRSSWHPDKVFDL